MAEHHDNMKACGARWNTLIGGRPPERQHVMEGLLLANETRLPPEIGLPGSLFFVTVIDGEVTWLQGGEATVIPAGFIAGMRDAECVRLRRGDGKRATHLVVWRFTRGTLREGMTALGLPPPSEALCWPILPRPLTPEMRDLFLQIRAAHTEGTARSWWYGSKLLELTALMHPAASGWRGPQARLREEVRRALVFLHSAYTRPISLEEVAREVGLSPTYLSRTFTKEMGVPLSFYLRSIRMEKAAQLLRSGECKKVTDAAMAVGYASISQFSGTFSAYFGMPPSAFIPTNAAHPPEPDAAAPDG